MRLKDNVKPGDLIEWAYRRDGKPVSEDEELWSSVEQRWVPIGPDLTHLCVSRDGKTITWLNEKGLFRVHKDDITTYKSFPTRVEVVPCVRE
jgi:hypothetical protein